MQTLIKAMTASKAAVLGCWGAAVLRRRARAPEHDA